MTAMNIVMVIKYGEKAFDLRGGRGDLEGWELVDKYQRYCIINLRSLNTKIPLI